MNIKKLSSNFRLSALSWLFFFLSQEDDISLDNDLRRPYNVVKEFIKHKDIRSKI